MIKSDIQWSFEKAFNKAVSNRENRNDDYSINWDFIEADIWMDLSMFYDRTEIHNHMTTTFDKHVDGYIAMHQLSAQMIIKCITGRVQIDYKWPDKPFPNFQIMTLNADTELVLDLTGQTKLTILTPTVLEIVNEHQSKTLPHNEPNSYRANLFHRTKHSRGNCN